MLGKLVLPFLMASALIAGCGQRQMSESDRELAIKECRAEIDRIKNDPTLKPDVKRDLIERSQLQLEELGAQDDTSR